MEKKTLLALRKSIKHWKDNVRLAQNGEDISISSSACALCGLFFLVYRESPETTLSCYGCPIFERTKKSYCEGTPYYNVQAIVEEGTGLFTDLVKRCKEEVKFLESLLPKKSKSSRRKS
jgi:hypothetical protein